MKIARSRDQGRQRASIRSARYGLAVLVSAAVCPHPPLLVAGIGSAHDDHLDALRAACWSAIDALRGSNPDALVVIGVGESTAHDAPRTGTLAPYGVDRPVALPGAAPPATAVPVAGDLPLSVCVGAWLLERDRSYGGLGGEECLARWPCGVSAATVADDAAPEECVRLGEQLAAHADRVAMLVMADGSVCHPEAPMTSPQPAQYDAKVAQAVRAGEPRQLLAVDGALAAEVGAAGLNPLRVLAGAVGEAVFDADVRYDNAPYGVRYLVGVWERPG